MIEFKEMRLQDAVTFQPPIGLKRGYEYPFIEMAEVDGISKFVHASYKKIFDGSGGARFNSNDILFARIEPCLNNKKISIATEMGHGSTEFFVLRAKSNIADQEYIFYFVRTHYIVQSAINSYVGASGRQRADAGFLKSLIIKLPALPIQQKIASILSAYEKLIENNNQRIKLLEEMAEEIYKEWFVRMRFPGYEGTTFFDAEGKEVAHGTVGSLAEGWEFVNLGKKFDISLGGTPSREIEQYWSGDIAWINSGKVNDLRVIEASEYITELGLKKSATKLLPKKTTLLAITGATLGQVSFLEIEACANQSVVGIKDPTNKADEFIFLTMKIKIKDLMNYASGGAQQHINKANVEETLIVLPPDQILESFCQIVKPQFDIISNLMFKNKLLQQTRDLLVPRLISGKLSVEHLLDEEEKLSIAAEPIVDYQNS